MKSFIVIGLGRFGNSVARELHRQGNEVLVIDDNAENIQQIADDVTHAVCADAMDTVVLDQVGARNFDCAIVCLASNLDDSILITLMLKEMGIEKVVSKAKNELHKKVLLKIGADEVVFPEDEMGERLAQVLSADKIKNFLELSEEYSITEIATPESFVGKTLIGLDIRAKYGVTIIAMRDRKSGILSASIDPHTPIEKDVDLIILGRNEDIKEIDKL